MTTQITDRQSVLVDFHGLQQQIGLGLSRTTLWRMVRDGRLPRPIKTSPSRTGRLFWRRDEIDAALQALETVP